MFDSTNNKGFQMTFDNGITISVQFGNGNYCSNRYNNGTNNGILSSSTAEIAIWDKEADDFKFKDGSTCCGWLSANEVADWINKVSKAETIYDIENSVY